MDSGLSPSASPGMTNRRDHYRPLELHRRHGLDFGAAGAEVVKFLAGEAEHAGEQRGRHLLDAGVVFLDRVVEEAAAGGDLVLEVGKFARELLEVGVGLEVG